MPAESASPDTSPVSVKRLLPWLVAVAFFMESLDTTILNTAVPVISKALGVTVLNVKSVLASYTLSLAVFARLKREDGANETHQKDIHLG